MWQEDTWIPRKARRWRLLFYYKFKLKVAHVCEHTNQETRTGRMENQQPSTRRGVSKASEDAKMCPLLQTTVGRQLWSRVSSQHSHPSQGLVAAAREISGAFPACTPYPTCLPLMAGWDGLTHSSGGKKSPEYFSALLLFQPTHHGSKWLSKPALVRGWQEQKVSTSCSHQQRGAHSASGLGISSARSCLKGMGGKVHMDC